MMEDQFSGLFYINYFLDKTDQRVILLYVQKEFVMKINYNNYVLPYKTARVVSEQLIKQGKQGNRSSKRTDALNNETIEKIFKPISNESWDFKPEQIISCSRGDTFKVDIVGYKNKEPKLYIFLKAVQSSYNKNRHNYGNTLCGEALRVFGTKKLNGVKCIFIDWIPYEVPSPTDKNKNRVEKSSPPDMSSSEKLVNLGIESRGHKNCSVSFFKIQFDYSKKGKISNTSKKDVDSLHKTLKKVLS